MALDPEAGRAVLAGGTAGIKVLALSPDGAPTLLGGLDTHNAFGVALDRDASRVWVADREGGLLAVDLSSPEAPVLLGSAPTHDQASRVTLDLAGQRVFVADDDAGFAIFDISDPAAPVELNTDVDVDGVTRSPGHDLLVVSGYFTPLRVFDVSDSTRPVERAEWPDIGVTQALRSAFDPTTGLIWTAESTHGLAAYQLPGCLSP